MSIKASFDDTGRMNMLRFTCLGFSSQVYFGCAHFFDFYFLEYLWYAMDFIADFLSLPFSTHFKHNDHLFSQFVYTFVYSYLCAI